MYSLLILCHSRTRRTPLFVCAQTGQTKTLSLLLEDRASVSTAMTDCGTTPLLAACEEGHTEAVELLLEAKADWTQADASSYYPPLLLF